MEEKEQRYTAPDQNASPLSLTLFGSMFIYMFGFVVGGIAVAFVMWHWKLAANCG